MAKNPMIKLLTAPDKGISQTSGPNGILARLLRTILYDENITPFKYMDLMDTFSKETQSGVPINRVDLTSWRGNITKELSNDRISWKVFCKALRFLRILRVEFTIRAHWHDGHMSTHSTYVELESKESMKALLQTDAETQKELPAQEQLPLDFNEDED